MNPIMELIQKTIIVALVVIGLIALVAGLITQAPHLFMIAIGAILLATFISEPLRNTNKN
jgi:hypothetical protein